MRAFAITLFMFVCAVSFSQDSTIVNKPYLLLLQLKESKNTTEKQAKSPMLPAHRQGKFCDFEDKLHRKKIPLNFSLGKGEY